jgi:hypothetical protein
MKRTWKFYGGAAVIVVAAAALLYGLFPRERTVLGMVVPRDTKFENAPSVETDEKFDVTFTFDDSSRPQVEAEGKTYQGIVLELTVRPKEGTEVQKGYCTLVVNDWLLEQSSTKDDSAKYMGYPKESAADFTGVDAIRQISVETKLLQDPDYEAQMTAPVKFMLAYDGREHYYYVTPTRAGD